MYIPVKKNEIRGGKNHDLPTGPSFADPAHRNNILLKDGLSRNISWKIDKLILRRVHAAARPSV